MSLLRFLKKFWCQIPEEWILSFHIVTIIVLHLCLDLQAGLFHSSFHMNYFTHCVYCYCFPSMSWSVRMVMFSEGSGIGSLVN